jgi:predicted phosphate transport protein (TIGR00153 family)
MDRTRNVFAWLGEREEKGVLILALKHVEKSYECVLETKNSIESLIKNDIDGKKYHISIAKNSEHEGDDIKKTIMNELSKGMFLPPDREDLMFLNEGLNDIADSAKGVVRLLEFFEKGLSPEFDKLLMDNSLLAVKAVEKLKTAINALVKNDANMVMEDCAQIETLEEEGDDKRRDLINALLKTELSQQMTILGYEMIDNLEDVIDCIKKTGDMVRILAIKAR